MDPLLGALAAAFAKHPPEEWGEGPLSDFIEEYLAAAGYRVMVHSCDLPPDHQGECWHESGSDDD